MKKICLLLTAFCLPVLAADEDLKALGIKFTDDKGCYLYLEYPDGQKSENFQTISFMLADYSARNKSLLKKDHAIEEIKKAIDSGCDINELYHGLSPLSAAILFNKKDMVYLLLNKGADPEAEVTAKGMNSYELVNFLLSTEFSKNKEMLDIKRILEDFRKDKN